MLNIDAKIWALYRDFWQAAMAELTEPRWAEATADAFASFFGEPAALAETPDAAAMMRFYEWLLWDYEYQEGSSIARKIRTQLQTRLGHGIWERWQWLPVRVVQVREIETPASSSDKTNAAPRAQLVDLLTGEDLTSVSAGNWAVGEILLGRWWNGERHSFPTPSIRTIPDEVFLFLQKALENVWHGYQGTIEDFLREHGAFIEDWLNQRIGRDWRRNNLLYQVHNFPQVLRRLRQTDGIYPESDRVIPLRGPMFFRWELEQSLQLVVDEEELLAVGGDSSSLAAAKLLLHYNLEGLADLVEENEYWPEKREVDIQLAGEWPRKQDQEVAELLLDNMQSYRRQQVENAVRLWHDFTVQEKPQFRRPEIWAAAVELAVRQIDADQPRKEILIEKYGISTTALDERYRRLKRSLGLVLGDHRYSTL